MDQMVWRHSVLTISANTALLGERIAREVVILSTCGVVSCSEASIAYRGTVTEGPATLDSFDTGANPNAATPIPGALVQLFFDGAVACSEAHRHYR